MNQATIDKLNSNPHYKGVPNQPDPEPEEKEVVKTYGVLTKQNTMVIPKHPVKPKLKVNKKPIENEVA